MPDRRCNDPGSEKRGLLKPEVKVIKRMSGEFAGVPPVQLAGEEFVRHVRNGDALLTVGGRGVLSLRVPRPAALEFLQRFGGGTFDVVHRDELAAAAAVEPDFVRPNFLHQRPL